MEFKTQQALYEAALKLVRPLIGVLLKHGISHGTFAEIIRQGFVDKGFEQLEDGGRRATTSGVAALTGLSRKEVKRLRESDFDALGEAAQRRNRAIRVISGWVNDPDFQSDGEPAMLSLEGAHRSFPDLVKRYGGDVTTVAMRSLLESSGNVSVDNGQVILEKRAFIPMDTPVDLLNILGTDSAELIETISHNLVAEPQDRFFQRKVSSALVPPDLLDEFREYTNRRSQELLEEYDAWLTAREVMNEHGDKTAYVAVGIYYTERSEEG